MTQTHANVATNKNMGEVLPDSRFRRRLSRAIMHWSAGRSPLQVQNLRSPEDSHRDLGATVYAPSLDRTTIGYGAERDPIGNACVVLFGRLPHCRSHLAAQNVYRRQP